MLARRELSEAQVRERLARRGHDDEAIDQAVGRLKEQHAIDDLRAATAIARVEAARKGRGRLRVRGKIERAGIAPADAQRAINEALNGIDDDSLIETAILRRLRGRPGITDDAEFRRLYRYLLGQGFEHDRILK